MAQKLTIFSSCDFSEDLRHLLEEGMADGMVAEVFEALKSARTATIEVGGKTYDQELDVTLMTDGEDSWIESSEGAANSRRLQDWCEGYAYGLEERFFETMADVAMDRARRRERGEDVEENEEIEPVIVQAEMRPKRAHP